MIPIPQLTERALGGPSLSKLTSRSLRLTRFSEPDSKDENRKKFFGHVFHLRPAAEDECHPLDRWLDWLQNQLKLGDSELLYGRLTSRLALHLSGGVMENASILLDRFGFPYIPGSGVKGVSRHAAIYALRTWCAADNREIPTEADEPASIICRPFSSPEDLAAELLATFGWTDDEWSDGRLKLKAGRPGPFRSDLEWAIGEGQPWKEARPIIAQRLAAKYRIEIDGDRPKCSFAGRSRFLDARPLAATYPQAPNDLELDVITCHHGEYYAGSGDGSDVPDTEDPIPVYFPTVAPGVIFVFAVTGPQSSFALECLKMALATFGAGAKTAAGYGWFDTSDSVRSLAHSETALRRSNVRQLRERRKAREAEVVRAEAERQRLEALAKRRAILKDAIDAAKTPEDKEDLALAELSDQQFETKIQGWARLDDSEKRPLLRALGGTRQALWDRIKTRAEKKGPWRTIVESIRSDARRLKITLT